MKLSNYFTLREATYSKEAVSAGVNNEPVSSTSEAIKETALRMDVFREHIGRPFTVTSWFRSKETNVLVNGSKTSVHMSGRAVDFTTKSNMREVYTQIINSKLSFDQCIYYPKRNFIHLGFCKEIGKERNQTWEETK